MSAAPASFQPPVQPPAQKPPRKQRFGLKFLVLSILAHVVFLGAAAYWIINTIAPRPKMTTIHTVPSTQPPSEPERKHTNAERQKGGAVPPKVVLSTGKTAIVMPPQPEITSSVPVVAPNPGPGLPGPGHDHGTSNGPGGDGQTIHIAGPGIETVIQGGLVGHFYDLKLTRGRQPTGIDSQHYSAAVRAFVDGGWNEGHLAKYLAGSHALYTTQVFFPEIDTSEGPKAFGSPVPDSPGLWIVVYRGLVSPPETGTYRFVGAGDDDMIVRIDGKLVLDNCEHIDPAIPSEGEYHYANLRNTFRRGLPVTLEAGKYYNIEILIGDQIPTKTMAALLIEKEGVIYQMEGSSPILPPFTVVARNDEAAISGPKFPPHMANGPVWKGKATSTSLLDEMK